MHDYDALIDAYIDHAIDDDGFTALCAWLREDPEHRQVFARKLAMHSEIAEWSTERSGGKLAGQLGSAEAEDELPTVRFTEPQSQKNEEYLSALSYVMRHTFTPKRIAMLATAAALLLGVVLAIVFLTGGPDDAQQIADTPEQLKQPGATDGPVNVQPIVAMLTAEHEAVWERRPGEDLFAGQRLTLTEGYAEITTQRGAVAVLEAPATIELIDSDNAIRLHTGKLVGICETESSKGFVVRTPHMDITDLGTRFGVEARRSDRTEVHVIEGSVAVALKDTISEPQPIIAGQALSVDHRGEMRQITYHSNPYVTDQEFDARKHAAYSPWASSMAARFDRARTGRVLLDLAFKEHKSSELHVYSLAQHDNPVTLNAEELVAGRFGQRTAAQFKDKDHFIQTVIDEPLDEMTLAGWYYIDQLNPNITSIMHSNAINGVHWHITRRSDGKATIGMIQSRERGLRDWSDARSEGISEDVLIGGWIHLSLTLDVNRGDVVLYLNGQSVAEGNADDFVPVQLGGFQIGNWQPTGQRVPGADPDRTLNGAIEAFVVINRVLTSEEIQAMYRSELP